MASRPRVLTLAVVASVVLGAGACGDDDDARSGGIDVSDAWARSSPAGVTDGVVYMTIESAVADDLIGGAVPADVAARVELHETVADGQGAAEMEGHDMAATEGTGAATTMRQVSSVELPGEGAVAFEPGGLHVMLVDLAAPLEAGSSFELTLTFATAGRHTVTVEIRDEAP